MASRTHYKLLLENQYLGQWDLSDRHGGHRKAIVEIASVDRYVPKVKTRQPSRKLKISFVGKRKSWIAGATSQKAIAALYGPIVEDWIGRRITLYVDPSVMYGKQRTGGLRVENRLPDGPTTADPLDEEVDDRKVEEIALAKGETEREPGEEG